MNILYMIISGFLNVATPLPLPQLTRTIIRGFYLCLCLNPHYKSHVYARPTFNLRYFFLHVQQEQEIVWPEIPQQSVPQILVNSKHNNNILVSIVCKTVTITNYVYFINSFFVYILL